MCARPKILMDDGKFSALLVDANFPRHSLPVGPPQWSRMDQEGFR